MNGFEMEDKYENDNKFIFKFDQINLDREEGVCHFMMGIIAGKGIIDILCNIDFSPERTPRYSEFTEEILETLEYKPELFAFMSEGITLISDVPIRKLERKRVEVEYIHETTDMVVDGAQNIFAIGLHVLRKAGVIDNEQKIKNWDELIEVWDESTEEIKAIQHNLPLHITVKLLAPRKDSLRWKTEEFVEYKEALRSSIEKEQELKNKLRLGAIPLRGELNEQEKAIN